MGIDDDAFIDAKGIAQDNIGRLAANSGERGKGFQRAGNGPLVLGDKLGCHGADISRLIAIETGRADYSLERLLGYLRVVFRSFAPGKKLLGDDIDALVRALRGKDGRHQQFERVLKVELAMCVRVNIAESTGEFARSLETIHTGS